MLRILILLLLPITTYGNCMRMVHLAPVFEAERILKREARKGLTEARVNAIKYLSFFTDVEAERVLSQEIQREDPHTRHLAIQALDDIQQVKYLRDWTRRNEGR